MDQKVKSCLNVKAELLNLEAEQRKLAKFVDQYNTSTIECNKELRTIIADLNSNLQK